MKFVCNMKSWSTSKTSTIAYLFNINENIHSILNTIINKIEIYQLQVNLKYLNIFLIIHSAHLLKMKRISVVKNDILCKYLNEWRNSLAKDRFKNTPSFTFKNWLFDKVTISSNNNLGYSFKAYWSKLTEDYNHYKENNILVTLSVKFWNSKGLIEYLRENFNNLNLYGVNAIFSPDNKNEQLKSVLDILRTSNLGN